MQTFLPYPDFRQSLECLDNKRLAKQRVETNQILDCLICGIGGYRNHPAVRMWDGHKEALKLYFNLSYDIWASRGGRNIMLDKWGQIGDIVMPPWIGRKDFHDSHKSNLLRKDQAHYSQFNWEVPLDLPYIWPV